MQKLNAQDAMFAYLESPRTPMHLGWLNIYDPSTAPGGQVGHEAVLDHVAQRLHSVRFFRQKLVFVPAYLDEPYWIDDENFDLDFHMRQSGLPAPGGWKQLHTAAARIFARPLDFNRPLWECHLIDGLKSVEGFAEGSFALLIKMHHAAIDGVSGVDVMAALHTSTPGEHGIQAPKWIPEEAPTTAALLKGAVATRITQPINSAVTLVRAVSAMRNVKSAIDSGDLSKPARHKVPSNPFSGPVGSERVIETRRLSIDTVNRIRKLVPGATINDVMLAAIGGALNRYLSGRQALPELSLTATCPISLRPEEERGEFGNRIANMFIALGTDVPDGIERLRAIQHETANAKGLNEALGAQTLTGLNELLPGALVSLGTRLASRITGNGAANTTVTNVQGPQDPLFLASARLSAQFLLGTLLDGMGLFHFVHSYCGEITLTVTADGGKMPDPTEYGRCLAESFDELLSSADRKPTRKRS